MVDDRGCEGAGCIADVRAAKTAKAVIKSDSISHPGTVLGDAEMSCAGLVVLLKGHGWEEIWLDLRLGRPAKRRPRGVSM